LLLYGDYN